MFKRQSIAISFLVLLVLVSSTLFVTYGAELAEKQIYKVGLRVSDITTLDPHFASTHGDRPIVKAVFSGLVDLPPDSVALEDIEPDLARAWSVSEDGTVWTFYLREGVHFHKGYGELTSEDVVYSLNRVRDQDVGSPFRGIMSLVQDVRAVDRYTVEIILHAPDPFLLYRVLGYQAGFIVSKKAIEEYGDRCGLNPIGTGPFVFEEHYPREKVTLVRNENYHKGAPILEGAEIYFMADDASRELALRTGEIHAADGLSDSHWLSRMANIDTISIDVTGAGLGNFIHFNMSIKPFDDLRVRQALSHAIDRELIAEWRGPFTSVLNSPIPKGYYGYTTEGVPVYDYDPEKAKALLAEAGFPDGFSFSMDISDANIYLPHMEIFQEMWRQVGVNVNLRVVDHASYHEIIRENKNPVIYYSAARLPIADIYLREFYHSEAIVGKPTAITNFSHFGDLTPGVDALIEAASVEMDSQRQLAMYQEIQQAIMECLPALPVLNSLDVIARHYTLDLGYEVGDTIECLMAQYDINEKMRILKD